MRVTYDHMMVINLWGEMVAELGGDFEGPEIPATSIDLSFVKKLRKGVSLLRRIDVYPEILFLLRIKPFKSIN